MCIHFVVYKTVSFYTHCSASWINFLHTNAYLDRSHFKKDSWWATWLSLFTFLHWRRKWQPTPAFLSGESQGWGSLVGCRLWGRTESDMTEATQQQQQQQQEIFQPFFFFFLTWWNSGHYGLHVWKRSWALVRPTEGSVGEGWTVKVMTSLSLEGICLCRALRFLLR